MFHHVSRHLSDRAKRFPVDWNMLGGRIAGVAATRPDVSLAAASTSAASSRSRIVDYRWELEPACAPRVALQPRVARGRDRRRSACVGVDGTRDRGTQTALRVEGGSASTAAARALELFVAAERRIDPYPLEFSTVTWLTAGFRISKPGARSACHNHNRLCTLHLPSRRAWRPSTFAAVVARRRVQAAVRPPKLQYQIMTLPNGLRVILSEDHSTPIVHVSVWYHVGSKNERAGRTGFAHLFEHMMFKGSKNVEPESHTSSSPSVGGRSNAYTTEDETVFWQTFPAQYLPLVLWLEADRMATLRMDDAAFRREREVVKEERRMRIENQPYGRLTRSSTTTRSRRIRTSTRRSAAWRTSRRPRSRTCASSTAPTTCRKTRR